MKLVFGILLLAHGAIHLLGFAKAFFSTKVTMQVLGVSKPIGAFWLITFVLFVVSAVLFFTKRNWFYLALLAVFISQILIILVWKDAKFGTLANIIILIICACTIAEYRFHSMVDKEAKLLFENINKESNQIITSTDITHLPYCVQKWMKKAEVLNKPPIALVKLKQTGELKTKPKGKWMPFTAIQYINSKESAFVWSAKIKNNSLIYILGRDKLYKGKAEMLIKLLGIFTVVHDVENHKIDTGSMQRYLGEMCWYPSAALANNIKWEQISTTSAKAIFTYQSQSVSGVFNFSADGDIISFETMRFFGGTSHSKKENWKIEIIKYDIIEGYRIPVKCKVTWKLKEGDFNWLNLEIEEINYNLNTVLN